MEVLSSRVSSLQTKDQMAIASRGLGLGGPRLGDVVIDVSS